MIPHMDREHDSNTSIAPRFIFRGHAVGAAGDLFPVRAPSSLPVIGGRSQASATAFPDPETDCHSEIARLVSWGAVTTSATGSFNRQTRDFETLVTATASDIRLNDTFEIANMSAALESSHPSGRGSYQELEIRTPENGIQIFGLRIFGWPVTVIPQDQLIRAKSTRNIQEIMANRKCGTPTNVRHFENQNYFFYSLVESADWREGQLPPSSIRELVTFEGHIIKVKDVGVFYLGEVLRNAGSCRLTLLRARLEMADGEEPPSSFSRGKKMLSLMASATRGPGESRESRAPERKESNVVFAEVESNGLEPPPD